MRRIETVPRQRGWRHLIAATRYSLGGLRIILQESAFRHEVIAWIGILIVFFAVGAEPVEYLVSALLFLITIAVEALNTAIEIIVDRSSPEISDFGKATKDLGSFAVFCMLTANGIFLLYVLGRHLI
ncbi:MAG: diacylglycerol kinase [Rhodobiaceae bacterium]|nr:diacylglycerol kinase [Rhodobiaceae bacterium]MCC0057104.1 diacylglycerol kinase [Rhodobiaceae bacterium]